MSAAALTSPDTARLGAGPATFGEAVRFFARQPSPRILASALALALALRLALGGFSLWDLVPPLLVALHWPFNEWLIHVFILHAKPFRIGSRTIDPLVPRKHRAHHRDPWNLELIFIPLHSFLYSLPLLVALAFLLAPTRELALSGLVAYLALALHYEWVHFICHTRYSPKSAHYRKLVRSHRLHHFKNEHYWYGVSMLAADRPLRTAPAPESVERSPTARTLGVEPLEAISGAAGAR